MYDGAAASPACTHHRGVLRGCLPPAWAPGPPSSACSLQACEDSRLYSRTLSSRTTARWGRGGPAPGAPSGVSTKETDLQGPARNKSLVKAQRPNSPTWERRPALAPPPPAVPQLAPTQRRERPIAVSQRTPPRARGPCSWRPQAGAQLSCSEGAACEDCPPCGQGPNAGARPGALPSLDTAAPRLKQSQQPLCRAKGSTGHRGLGMEANVEPGVLQPMGCGWGRPAQKPVTPQPEWDPGPDLSEVAHGWGRGGRKRDTGGRSRPGGQGDKWHLQCG